jgi:hypothetical protein
MKAGGGINWLCLFDENEFMRPWLLSSEWIVCGEWGDRLSLFVKSTSVVFDLIFDDAWFMSGPNCSSKGRLRRLGSLKNLKMTYSVPRDKKQVRVIKVLVTDSYYDIFYPTYGKRWVGTMSNNTKKGNHHSAIVGPKMLVLVLSSRPLADAVVVSIALSLPLLLITFYPDS